MQNTAMLKFSKMHTKFSSGELHCDIPLDSPNHNLIITSQGYVFFFLYNSKAKPVFYLAWTTLNGH